MMQELFKEIWGFVLTAGPAGIFAVMWWLERADCKQANIDKDEMAKEMLKAMTETAVALSSIKDVVTRGGRR